MSARERANEQRVESLCVAVLSGGRSSEREVSLRSGKGIARALRGELTRSAALPREVLEVEIDAEGRWIVEGAALAAEVALARLERVDVFFLGLHGGEGEDGTIQGFLSASGRVHTGSGVRASAVCMDKLATRGIAQSVDVRVAAGMCFCPAEWGVDRASLLARIEQLSSEGWVIKPRFGGSSVATTLTRDRAALEPAVEAVLATGDDVLVEARVAGIETSCGVLGERGDSPRALMPIEIRPTKGEWFDYAEKYSADGAHEYCPPRSVGERSITRIRHAAERVFARTRCEGYARIDFIVPSRGGVELEPVMLEVNTLPGFTERSLLPQEAAFEGLDYTALCVRILESALRKAAGAR
ncbi:MAG: D-alanine--D-alanine ligase [Planctomycetes bacterium]|nr:D-alanine--D-alanine ligase [Planctomycetota bacterium]